MPIVDRRPFLHRPGEGRSVWSLGGHFTIKADGMASDGRFSLIEALAWRSTEPPTHIHQREDEAWYVLDGQMTFRVGDEEFVASTGSFAFAPRGLPHAFTVDVEPTRVLVLASPAGFEQFAVDLGTEAVGDDPPADLPMPSPEAIAAVGDRYGIEVVGPPIRVALEAGR